eukprot:TRINITY_DN8540_c0_g1_i4.p1 TRINITY_DN8540_c0_g1~~TRINITY_DN8540_c0_g1_i4.p1  ORF type:complete len:214 (-),score=62.78 TRINITY_DN8540_c0_g1_i4:71-712(-)
MEKILKTVMALVIMMTMVEAEEDLEVMLREMMKEMNIIKSDLQSTKEELLSHIDAKDNSIYELEREVYNLQNPPQTFACAGHYSVLSTSRQAISYSNLLYSSSNVAGAGMNITSGQFISGVAGTYTVTWSLRAINDAGDHSVHINLRKNEKNIDESLHYSRYTGPSGYAYDQGGRTLVLHLDSGDTVDLFCNECSAGIDDITFCVSLAQADLV